MTREQEDAIEAAIEGTYDALEGSEEAERYHGRHGIRSLGILTVSSMRAARLEADKLRPHVEGKSVVEVGAGAGLLSFELARIARRVTAIEVDPAWTAVYLEHLYKHKPPNLTWVFGRAEEVALWLRADVAVVYTCSDIQGMKAIAGRMAPLVIHGPLTPFDARNPFGSTHERLGRELARLRPR